MSRILALDTSTQACSVAVLVDGVMLEDFRIAPRQHNSLILPMIEQLMHQAGLSFKELDAIAFGRGPGSFTGLRIAAGVVQGLAYGADIPVVPVSTLAALALEGFQQTQANHWLAALDARMGEIYVGGYSIEQKGDELSIQSDYAERVVKPELLEDIPFSYQGIGSGWCYQDILVNKLKNPPEYILSTNEPRAACIATLADLFWQNGESVAAYDAIPVYLRDEISWEKQPLKIGKR